MATPSRGGHPPVTSGDVGTERVTGRVRVFFADTGRGVIEGEDGAAYRFSRADVAGYEIIGRGGGVVFTPTQGPHGPRAVDVQRLQPPPAPTDVETGR
jgi:cold shock CspA family protein